MHKSMIKYLAGSAAALAMMSAPAWSYTFVAYGGNADAKTCYEAALWSSPSNSAFRACDEALKFTALTKDQEASILVNRGILKFEVDDFNGAYKDYNAALAINPDLAEAYANRGTVLFVAERYDEALADYNQSLTLSPQDEMPVRLNRAMVLHALGQAEAAEADYIRVLDISKDPAGAREKMRAFKASLRS